MRRQSALALAVQADFGAALSRHVSGPLRTVVDFSWDMTGPDFAPIEAPHAQVSSREAGLHMPVLPEQADVGSC